MVKYIEKYIEKFVVPGVGMFGIEDLENSTHSSPIRRRYRLWCNGPSIDTRTSLEEARKAMIHHCCEQLQVKRVNLHSKLSTTQAELVVVLDSLDRILEGGYPESVEPCKMDEFQVELEE